MDETITSFFIETTEAFQFLEHTSGYRRLKGFVEDPHVVSYQPCSSK